MLFKIAIVNLLRNMSRVAFWIVHLRYISMSSVSDRYAIFYSSKIAIVNFFRDMSRVAFWIFHLCMIHIHVLDK